MLEQRYYRQRAGRVPCPQTLDCEFPTDMTLTRIGLLYHSGMSRDSEPLLKIDPTWESDVVGKADFLSNRPSRGSSSAAETNNLDIREARFDTESLEYLFRGFFLNHGTGRTCECRKLIEP